MLMSEGTKDKLNDVLTKSILQNVGTLEVKVIP